MLLCLQYRKEEEARFLSHLDLMTAMERAFRRADLPLVFSEGFNPHPRVSYASALAVGVTSDAEYLDVQLQEDLPAELVAARLNKVLPRGLRINTAVVVTGRTESLMALINMARYRVEVFFDCVGSETIDDMAKTVEETIARAMAQESFSVRRRSKKKDYREVDIRPGVLELTGRVEKEGQKQKLILEMTVQTGSGGNVKPEEVAEMVRAVSLFHLGEHLRIHRVGLFIHHRGQNWSPLEIEREGNVGKWGGNHRK